jgi:hypothetical protein
MGAEGVPATLRLHRSCRKDRVNRGALHRLAGRWIALLHLQVEFINDFIVSFFCLFYIAFKGITFPEGFAGVDPVIECSEENWIHWMIFNGHWLVTCTTILWAVSGERNALQGSRETR